MADDVRLLTAAFDPAEELRRFTAAHPSAGGVVSFLGQVRQDDAVEALSSLMEPIIMVVLGTLIGGMVVAMYLPIFDMMNAVQ